MTDALTSLEPAEAPPLTLRAARARPAALPHGTTLRVRVADPAAVEHDVLRVWAESLKVEGDAGDKLRWFYRDGPEGPGTLFTLVAGGEGEEQVVGVAGAGVRAFRAGGETLRAALLVDLSIVRRHRTLLPALRLVGQVREHVRERFDLAYGLPNRSAAGVFERQGFAVAGRMGRFVRVLRHAPYLARRISLPVLPAVAGALIDSAGSLGQRARRLAKARPGRLVWAGGFDDRFDRLLAEAEASYPLVGRRSASFLAWRFFGHPVGEPRIATLLGPRSLRAYAVVERDGEAAAVRDLFGHPDELGPLIERLGPALRAEGVASLSFRFLGAPWLAAQLSSLGFSLREASRTVCLAEGLSLEGRKGPAPFEPQRWFLTDADEDI